MEKKVNNALEDVISSITNSKEFLECVRLKDKMKNSEEICLLVDKIKKLQKKYTRTQDIKVKEDLDILEERLNNIPLYDSYKKNLDKVNRKIEFIKDELNNYFNNIVNQ